MSIFYILLLSNFIYNKSGDIMNIGEKIKKYRNEKGITQKELAQKIGVTPPTLASWESGKRTPKFETVKRIAKGLGVGSLQLYGDSIPNDVIKEIKKEWALSVSSYKEKTLLSNFNSVNEDGQQKIVDYSSDIADNPKYKKDK